MTFFLILIAVVIFVCVLLNNASSRIGVPVLLAFILFGIVFSHARFIPFNYDENLPFASDLCSVALLFIMFYGGFGTRWNAAKPVAVEAGLLASLGVVLTAGLTGLLTHFILGWNWVESFLLGSVLSSTDAASVFSILRSRRLGLKNHTAPMLEVESGSNDPFAYMLTVLMISILDGTASGLGISWLLFAQIAFGALCGLAIAMLAVHAMRRISFATDGFDSLFVLAIAIASYAIPTAIGGNGYLSAYLVGIILGNQDFSGKKDLVHFFDGLTGLMQVLIFFMLGLLAEPARLGRCFLPALGVFLIISLLSRPVAVAAILAPFRKYPLRQRALVSFAGLRGASSIVFAIMAMQRPDLLQHDIFNVVFCVVLLSITVQGSLIPLAAKKLDMIDEGADIMSTFSDFSEETEMTFSEIIITADSAWKDRAVRDLGLPKNMLLCMRITPGGHRIVPTGDTVLKEGDAVVICARGYKGGHGLRIRRRVLERDSHWIGLALRDLPLKRHQIVLIRRGAEEIIPYGDTILAQGDVLYINQNVE